MVNASKVTSALLAAAEVGGHRAASRWVFTLDNGQRFEADEVKRGDGWVSLTPQLAGAIVDNTLDDEDGALPPEREWKGAPLPADTRCASRGCDRPVVFVVDDDGEPLPVCAKHRERLNDERDPDAA